MILSWRPAPRAASLVSALLLGSALLPGAVSANPEDATLSLTPWSGTLLQFTDEDARFSGAFSTSLGHGVWGMAEMSVPLNPVADQAVLVDSNGAVTGFTARASLGWDSTYALIGLSDSEDFKARAEFCKEHGLTDCTDTAIAGALDGLADALSNYHNIRPSPEVGRHYSVALEVAGSYAGISALADPAIRTRSLFHDYVLEAGPALAIYWDRMILNLRPGVGVAQDLTVDELHSCTGEDDGATAAVSVCFDDLVVTDPPQVAISGHARAAATLWDTQSRLSGELAPGIEIRTGFEDLFTGDPRLNLRLTGFLGPKAFPLGLRSGLGVSVDLALSGEDRILQTVTPFAFIGATFGSSHPGQPQAVTAGP